MAADMNNVNAHASGGGYNSGSRSSGSGSFQRSSFMIDAMSGLAGGVSNVIVGMPFDVVKTRAQVTPNASFPAVLSHILQREGPRGLWRGVAGPIVAYPLDVCINMSVYAEMRRRMDGTDNKPFVVNACAGAVSGTMITAVTTPAELVKTTLQTRKLQNGNKDVGPFNTLRAIVNAEGPLGLYRGFAAMLLREVPGNALFFVSYEELKSLVRQMTNSEETGVVVGGGCAGAVYWTAVMPVDAIKTRIQAARCAGTSTTMGIFQAAQNVYREGGLRAFFKGWVPAVARAFPANAALFTVVESTRDALCSFNQ
ncbi:mitochondrial carnitine/acylcarnitine transporter [Pycnococcus provasolii]